MRSWWFSLFMMAEVYEIDRQSQWVVDAVLAAGGEGSVVEAISESKSHGVSPIDAVLDTGVVAEDRFLKEVADRMGMPWYDQDLVGENVPVLKSACGPALAIRHRVVPVHLEEDEITLACYDPLSMEMRQVLSRRLPYEIRWVMTERRKLRTALGAIYGVGADTFEKLMAGRDVDFEQMGEKDEASVLDEDDSDEASVLRFVNQIIREALRQKATDIHIEPQHDILRIRYRVDGQLMDVPVPERINALQSSVIARLKIMSRLDVAERRVPQDGRINLKLEGKSIDVRVATIPSVEGETVSLRLLNQEKFSLDQLGMEESVRGVIDHVLSLTHGVILATGPTGSGKSTSLYCFLNHLNKPETRTVTIEDPVENKLPGIVQIAVKPEVGLTFAKGLRSILRADPNIVMVGEIRDTETAEIAIRASLTGHLVFSTLHTNTAIGGISRLLDMDIEPFLVAASVRAFLAQRLVRRLCVSCKEPLENFGEEERERLGIPAELEGQPYKAVGCGDCRQTGYSGRIAIYEICQVGDEIQNMITQGADENQILKQAMLDGFEPMRSYGWRKVMKGVTSIEEVLSSTQTNVGARAAE